jgi:hypothetical protein
MITFPIDKLAIVLLLLAILVAISLWRFHRDPTRTNFDLTDLLIENGRLSKIAVAFLTTLMVTTWMMIYMTMNKTMTEGYFTLYAGAWIAPIVARILKGAPPTEKEGPAP